MRRGVGLRRHPPHPRFRSAPSLVPGCHEAKHFGLALVRRREAYALAQLVRINSRTEAEAERYAKGKLEEWRQRSQYQWTQDLSAAAQYGLR